MKYCALKLHVSQQHLQVVQTIENASKLYECGLQSNKQVINKFRKAAFPEQPLSHWHVIILTKYDIIHHGSTPMFNVILKSIHPYDDLRPLQHSRLSIQIPKGHMSKSVRRM